MKEGERMEYFIKTISRTVQLNDALVNKYCEYEGNLRDGPFVIAMEFDYGHIPTESEMSDEEMSKYCNEVLIDELKTIASMPKLVNFLENGGFDSLVAASKKRELVEIAL